MRNLILTSLVLITSIAKLLAQSNPPFSWTFKTGYSLSVTQLGTTPFSETRRWGARGVHSLFFNTEIEYSFGNIGLSSGLQYIEKGFNTSYSSYSQFITEHISYQYRLHYLEVPINLKIKKRLIVGIIGSFLFDDDFRYTFKQTVTSSGTVRRYQYEVASQFPFHERYKQFDLGINLGYNLRLTNDLSCEINIQKHFVNIDNWNSVDLRYNLCFLVGLRYYPF
jgi:hypothetical protein